MKNKKWNNFKNGYAGLIILTIAHLIAGLGMIIVPEKTSYWVIRIVGLALVLEGIYYVIDIWKKYLKRNGSK